MKKEGRLKKMRKKAMLVFPIATVVLGDAGMVLANGVSTSTGIPQIDSMLNTLKGLFLGIIAAIGLIILIKSIGDTAQAYQQADSHGMYDGAKGIAAGAIMVFIGAILAVLGL